MKTRTLVFAGLIGIGLLYVTKKKPIGRNPGSAIFRGGSRMGPQDGSGPRGQVDECIR